MNVENRIRIESNYTTRSGERLIPEGVSDIGSINSGGKRGGRVGTSNKSKTQNKLASKKLSKVGLG